MVTMRSGGEYLAVNFGLKWLKIGVCIKISGKYSPLKSRGERSRSEQSGRSELKRRSACSTRRALRALVVMLRDGGESSGILKKNRRFQQRIARKGEI